jgi:DHA1 family bicyclomycin/chloramphenicol resistance-like MFS transporter
MNASLLSNRRFVITLGMMTAAAALTVDVSLPAIPAMVDALDTTLPRGQLIVGIFMAGMAVGQIPAGLFSDRLGRLPVLYAGLAVFTLAAIAAAAASSIELMLISRFIQGAGAASSIVLSRAIVRDIAYGKEAARLMSLMTMIFTVAPVIAPTIGALLVAQWGWRAPFILIVFVGLAIVFGVRSNIVETHTPNVDGHPVRQLISSFREFFSHRQSVWALMLQVLPPAGFMSVISVSAALIVEIYGYSLQAYGLVFAAAGVSILVGSFVNRILVPRFDQMQLIGVGVVLILVASSNMAIIAWLDSAPLWWLWSSVCLFMFTIAILMANSMVLALDPLPRIAGVASSIVGTLSNIVGAAGAMVGASIYNGTIRNSVIIMAAVGLITALIYVMKPLIAPGAVVQHPEELARD